MKGGSDEKPIRADSPPSASPSRRSSSRLVGLDAARVLATLGIVWVHVSEIQGVAAKWTALGRFGTSFYIMAAVFFAARSRLRHPDASTADLAKKRARRLLLPYVLWCAVYATFYLSTMIPQGYSAADVALYWGPAFGTAPHLWFLPFAFCAGVLTSFCVARLARLSTRALAWGGIIATLGSYLLCYGWIHPALDQGWLVRMRLHRLGRWVEEAPLVVGAMFGLTLYVRFLPQLAKLGKKRRLRLSGLCFLGFLLVQAAYARFLKQLTPLFWTDLHFFANAAGAFWLVAFVAARDNKWLRRLAPYGQATYFAFLAHQLVIDITKRGLSYLPGHGTIGFALVCSVLVFLISAFLGRLVGRIRPLRWLVP